MKVDTTQNESALVCAARDGDKEALHALLTRHWTWLKALVYSVVGDATDLDDVMQEVCLRVMTRIQTLREPECFSAWLAMVARREALKHLRQKGRRRMALEGDLPQPPTGRAEGPLEDLERKELCRRILDLAGALPPMYREVFMLAHAGELTYAQMAEVLDIPMTTMQIRLVRARRMIRDQLTRTGESKVQKR